MLFVVVSKPPVNQKHSNYWWFRYALGYRLGLLNHRLYIKGKHMTTEIITTIAKFIAEKILKQPNKVIAADEALISSGLIDSFSLMDLALFIEDTFGVRVEDTELNAETFDNLNQLAALISSRK
jgi:acyl carrier protein